MRKTGKCLIVALCLTLAAVTGAAIAGIKGEIRPHRYAPSSLDLEPVTAVNPMDGSVMAAWGYWESGEYSIAISIKTGEAWSEPVFIGRNDRVNQVDPALAFDQNGTAYLAFSVPSRGQILITAITGDPEDALAPRTISQEGTNVGMPALQVVGDRLVAAFRTGGTITMLNLPLYPTGSQTEGTASTRGIAEAPDNVDPLSRIWDGDYNKDTEEDYSGDSWESEDGRDPHAVVPLDLR
jgi:hypothetical protein